MHNNKRFLVARVCAVMGALALTAAHSVQAVTINNWPAVAGQDVGFFGFYLGQSFVSPVTGAGHDLTLTFKLSDLVPSNETDVSFSVLLTDTTGGTGNAIQPNAVLGNTGVLALTGSACAGSVCTVTFDNLSLTNGATYAWILEAAAGSDYGSIGGRPGYAGGHYFSTQNYNDPWSDTLDGDLAFDLTITAPVATPVPAAVWLFGSGLFGLLGVARRKNGRDAS